jgi:subfamily B ATP-binding cassette protein MsbA
MTQASEFAAGVIYRRLLTYALPYKQGFIVAGIAMLLFSGTSAAFAWMMEPIFEKGFINRDQSFIDILPLLIIGLFLFRGIAGFVSSYGISWVGKSVVRDLRKEIFDHLLRMPTAYFDKSSSGILLSTITYNTEQISNAASNAITSLIKDTSTFVFLLGVLLYRSWLLTLIFLVVAPVTAIIVLKISKRFRQISRRIQESVGIVTHVAEEAIDGHRVIKTFDGHDYESAQFGKSVNRNRQQGLKLEAAKSIGVSLIELIGACGLAVIIYFATHDSMKDIMSASDFASYITALVLLQRPIKKLMTVNAYVQRGIAAAQSIFSLLDHDQEKDTGDRTLEEVKGNVEYRNVMFSYETSGSMVLDNVNLHIREGQTAAFVGKSGSGKTTLVSLLPRFYDTVSGEIRIDGVDIHDLTLKNLRQHIALVSQHVTLFNDTIRNNIAYGALANASDDRINQAIKLSHSLEFIEKLPDGIDTIVGEDGVLLSGGQRQRLAIARALLKDAPILILDEATSSLDTESERFIQEALEELMQERTTLVIAHRLSTIERADVIFVLHEGHIVEQGTHQSLIEMNGYYTNLHNMQYSEIS